MEPIGIVYSFVSNEKEIIIDHSEKQGNFHKITEQILENLELKPQRISFIYDESESKHVFGCLAYKNFGNKLPFIFLNEIAQKYLKLKDDLSEFKEELSTEMIFFSKSSEEDKIIQIKEKVQDVKDVMVTNIDKLIERGEKLNILVERTQDLSNSAQEFSSGARNVNSKMKWQSIALFSILMLFIGISFFLLFMYLRN